MAQRLLTIDGMRQRFMTFEELAQMTGLNIKTLRHQRLHGEGLGSVGFRVDGRVLFDVEAVERYIALSKEKDINADLWHGPLARLSTVESFDK